MVVSQDDPYIDSRTGCLKNRLGITDPRKLDTISNLLVSVRQQEIMKYSSEMSVYISALEGNRSIYTNLTLKNFQSVHLHLYQDIYTWAGETRRIDLSKDEIVFPPASGIERISYESFEKWNDSKVIIKQQRTPKLEPQEFSDRVSHRLIQLTQIHPFREGNAQTYRTVLQKIAHGHDYHINWQDIEASEITQACFKGKEGDSQKLSSLIRTHLTDKSLALESSAQKAGIRDDVHFKVKHAVPGEVYRGLFLHRGQEMNNPLEGEFYIEQCQLDHPEEIILHRRRSLTPHVVVQSCIGVQRPNEVAVVRYSQGDIGLVEIEERLENYREDRVREAFVEDLSYTPEDYRQEYRAQLDPEDLDYGI